MSTNFLKDSGKLAALVLVALLAGCEQSQQNAKVTGRVTLDGKPLDRGALVFRTGASPHTKLATGNISEDGTYLVQFGQSGKVISGEYQVEVSAVGPSTPHPQGGPPTAGELITPAKYADSETSGLRYFIRPGKNVIDITLVSDPPADAETPEEGDAMEQVETAEEVIVEMSVDEHDEVTVPEDASGENGHNQQAESD